ncbi:MAG: hypothetical protein Q7T18_02565, partial [Sedimentisphaerales bacterium]|nr:hypothetical protein [Sedimentisphaerales bacterium]
HFTAIFRTIIILKMFPENVSTFTQTNITNISKSLKKFPKRNLLMRFLPIIRRSASVRFCP